MTEPRDWESESNQQRAPGTSGGDTRKMAREKAGDMAEEVRHRGQNFLEDQKRTAAESLNRLASALQDTSSNLERDQSFFSGVFRESAGRLERFADTLRERDTDHLMHQVQDFARRQPALLLGGTVAAGFFLSRILKSSSHRAEDEYASRERRGGDGRWQHRDERQSELFSESSSRDLSGGSPDLITSPTEPERQEEREIILGSSERSASEGVTSPERPSSKESEKKRTGSSLDEGELPGYGTFPNVKEDKDAHH